MSMETLNVIQLMQLYAGYIGFTVILPAIVFYPKTKRFKASIRFLIAFTIGNFYVINLVQILELLHISNRFTLTLGTFVPAILCALWLYELNAKGYMKTLISESGHYILREMGLRTFLRRRFAEVRAFVSILGKNAFRLIKENLFDFPFIVITALLVWKVCGPGILHNWGYGASDIPVHNYWINGLIDNDIYVAGIYPMGMHCMLYYLAEMLNIPVYVTLRLFWFVQFSMIAVMILAFLKACCKTRFIPYLAIVMFVGGKWFNGLTYSRYGATLPQEYGMLYILPSIIFAMEFFRTREEELKEGINRIRCTSTWYLVGFALSFSLTLTSHFYDTIVAGVICIGIAIGYGYWFFTGQYFFRVMAAGICSILLAFLPMAAAFLTGKSLQGSMYWAMNVIGLRDYTVLIFRIICLSVVGISAGGIFLVYRGIKKGTITDEDQKVRQYHTVVKVLLQLVSWGITAGVIYLAYRYKGNLMYGIQQNVFSIPDMNWIVYGIIAAVGIGLIYRLVDPPSGAALISMVIAEIFLSFILISGSLGWPMIMEPYRICIYVAYLIPVIFGMILDGGINVLFLDKLVRTRVVLGFLTTSSLIYYASVSDWIRGSFGGGGLEMNEAILCTTNILKDNEGMNNQWTIVSANDEYRMVEKYGRHTETIDFLTDMEYWNATKEVLIPTQRVYFYIEKKPLNYANGYGGIVPEVSREEASKPLPVNSGINAYNGADRSVTMSRMYYWAQKFMELYPNEMKVYFENDRFVCYYIEQNEYRLYNFAIDYEYN